VRIALACPYSWDAPGGVQVHVAQLANHLRRRGHDVLVVAPGLSQPDDDVVKIVARPVAVRYQGTVAPIAPWPWSAGPIGRTLKAFGPDLVHAHEPLTLSTSLYAVLRSPAPAVATFHAFAESSALYTAAAPFLRPVWKRLSARIAVSEAAARFVGKRFRGTLRVIPNGCDGQPFAEAQPLEGLPDGRRMVWVGRLDGQKGFPIAVRAFERLASEFSDLSFVIVGDGRDRQAVSSLGVDACRRVVLAGSVSHRDLPGYVAGADVFVAPAVGQESFGIVLVEAMAAGVPVVASDIEGYREVVRPGVDGILTPPGDPLALADAVRQVLSDSALAGRLAESAKARAQRFRWEVVIEEIESVYREVQEGRR
jgi:phosphatidyl-myo-inositol alpha-mannosyltransferase